jgi:hypothetical protein
VVGVAGGHVQVVQHHDDRRAARPVEVGQQVEDLDLVAHVEEGRRLVEQQQVGLLSQCHRDPHPLALPTGQLVDGPVGQRRRLRRLQRCRHRGVVLGAPAGEDPLVRMAAAADEIGDGDALGGDGRLREQPQGAGQLLGGQPVHGLAVEQHLTTARGEQAGHRAEQRRHPAGVRADDARDPPERDDEVEVVDDRALAVAEGQVLGVSSGACASPPAPGREVPVPTGPPAGAPAERGPGRRRRSRWRSSRTMTHRARSCG